MAWAASTSRSASASAERCARSCRCRGDRVLDEDDRDDGGGGEGVGVEDAAAGRCAVQEQRQLLAELLGVGGAGLAGGFGEAGRGGGRGVPAGPRPGPDSVFRIASMTKSFTAAAVLLLRDEGALALDDEAVRYVPELAGVRLPTADAPPITLRNLLTMTAGFPTDDPWGDRQQGLPEAAFGELIGRGLSLAWTPGTTFEYSNLGYALLGRVVAVVAGRPYVEFVTRRLLDPCGLKSTCFEAADVPADRLAVGHASSELG